MYPVAGVLLTVCEESLVLQRYRKQAGDLVEAADDFGGAGGEGAERLQDSLLFTAGVSWNVTSRARLTS